MSSDPIRGGRGLAHALDTVTRWVDSLNGSVGTFLGLVVVVVTGLQCFEVIVRKLGSPTIWSSEVAVYLAIYVAFLGAGYTERENGHTNVDVLMAALPRRGRLALEAITASISLIAVLCILYLGSLAVFDAYGMDRRSVTAMRLPLYLLYLALPLGMLLLALQYLVRIGQVVAAATGHARPGSSRMHGAMFD